MGPAFISRCCLKYSSNQMTSQECPSLSPYMNGNSCLCSPNTEQIVSIFATPHGNLSAGGCGHSHPWGNMAFVVQITQLGSEFSSANHLASPSSGASLVAQTVNLQCRFQFDLWLRKIPWGKEWLSTAVFLPGKSHGQRRLAGCSPWGHKESNMAGRLLLSPTLCKPMGCSMLGFPVIHHLLESVESVMPSNYLILCHPLLLLPSIFPSIRVFSNESVL